MTDVQFFVNHNSGVVSSDLRGLALFPSDPSSSHTGMAQVKKHFSKRLEAFQRHSEHVIAVVYM